METISILFFTPFMLLYLTRNPPSELFFEVVSILLNKGNYDFNHYWMALVFGYIP